MDELVELVLPPARRFWITQIVFTGCTALLGLFLVSANRGLIGTALGLLCLAVFAGVLASSMRGLRAGAIVLRADGFRYGGEAFMWREVTGFTPVGLFGKTHVRIVLGPNARVSPGIRCASAASKFGCNLPAIHIPFRGYETDGRRIDTILESWRVKAPT
jgi:hypothetical protein